MKARHFWGKRYAFVDVETCGNWRRPQRIVQIGLITRTARKRGEPWETRETFDRLINPGVPINRKYGSDIHNIYDSDVRDLDYFRASIDEIEAILASSDLVIGHASHSDRRHLENEFARHGRTLPGKLWGCTHKKAKHRAGFDPSFQPENFQLATVATASGAKLGKSERLHNALVDAKLCEKIDDSYERWRAKHWKA